ncbi:efflux RND transporter permease subunit [uncultured Thiohalocapsa sp.]|uniref:efflux RND transporter permease subunit n=1 Tax=uncultured Thiohalocapsa sp. TaxID=768990 RepID=UPI0025E34876|nr:efflux RND transporter permease subunit [uncultured Thiohalocapsa sp.]
MIRYFAHHPTAANMLMVLFLALGLVSLPQLKRETFPDFAASEVQVQVPYPGAAAEDIENAICRPLEDAVTGIADLHEVRCEAREGMATAVAEMTEGADFARFLDDVKTEVDGIDSFPEDIETIVITQLGRMDPVVSIAITGPMADRDLKAYAEQVKDRLRARPEVSQVTVQGFADSQFHIALRRETLLAYGLSVDAVMRAVADQGLDLPAGSIESRDREVLIRFDDERQSVQALEDLVVVGAAAGGEVRLGELATVTDRFEDPEVRIEFDGRRAAVLRVTKTKQQDTLDVMAAVQAFLDAQRAMAPPGVRFQLTQNVSSIVEDRLTMLATNGLQGLVLVFLAMALFFRLRFAFWVAMGLPVAFLGALFFMGVLGLSVNMISMVALLIALGLLMDDAIVIAENIATKLAQGQDAMTAAVDGTAQVAPGVIASFLTTVAVFGPLAFLSGDIGKVLKVLPVVLILVLAVSLVEAFLILPRHLGHALTGHERDAPPRWRVRFEQGIDWFRERVVGRAVDGAMASRYLFLGAVVALLIVTLALMAAGLVKFRAFPDIEGDVMEARILLPQGTPLSRTEAVVERITAALAEVNAEFTPEQPAGPGGEPEPLVQQVSVHYNTNADAFESGPHVATVSADLLTAERRTGSMQDYLNRWRVLTGPVADVISVTFTEPTIGPAGRDLEIRLSGDDLDRLKAAAVALQDWLASYAGVQDMTDDLRPGKPEVALRLKDGATSLGVTAAMVARQVRDAFQGAQAREIQVGRESYEVEVGLADPDRTSLRDLLDFRIQLPAGAQVPVSAVADLTESRGYARIQRIDGRRTITVYGQVDAATTNAAQIVADTRARFIPDLQQRFPDVDFGFEGQARESAATGGSMLRGFGLGLLGVFLLLAFLFRSWLEPFAVMAAIPLALVGVVTGHLLMGLELSMPSIMGFVSLSGIVVNDSILLVEFLKIRVRQGMSVPEAARRASRERFRAVLLTSVTTIAGLLPLLAERSLQAQVLIPLATSIVFGLLASTLLVLFVVPALFAVFDDLGWTSREKILAEEDDGRRPPRVGYLGAP